MSSIGSILCRAPNLSMIEVLRVPGYGLWFSAALHQCVLARAVERRREKLPNEKHTLCWLRPEAHMIIAVAQIESAGAVLGAAIWLNDVLYASRVAGNISWLLGASIALSLAAYEYVEVQRESVKQEVTLDEVKVEEVEDVTEGSSYKL